jgi:iron-sulfur cluster assembly accessory protein
MIITDEAKDKVVEYIDNYIKKTQENDIFFRVSVYPDNCHKYKMGFDKIKDENDEVYDFDGFEIRVDKESADKLIYSTLDFVNFDGKFGFNIDNPEKRECKNHGTNKGV